MTREEYTRRKELCKELNLVYVELNKFYPSTYVPVTFHATRIMTVDDLQGCVDTCKTVLENCVYR